MSQTFEIFCQDCRKTLWVGQGNYIYKTEDALKALEDFLFAHRLHQLGFGECQEIDPTFEEILYGEDLEEQQKHSSQ